LSLSFEVALPLGAIAFYLYDCAIRLCSNELIYMRTAQAWRVTGGFDVFIFGRRLCLPGLLSPHALLVRVAWSEDDARPVATEWPPSSLRRALRPLQVICSVLHVMLLVLLPVFSIALGAGFPLLALFAVFYFLTIVALIVIYSRRDTLGLDMKTYWLLAVDVVFCPPFAVNIVRKISLRCRLDGNPLAFATAQFGPTHRRRVASIVAARVDALLRQAVEGSDSASKLNALRERLNRECA
jgi:hypothetical protein